MDDKWIIFQNGQQTSLNNTDYLNYLLKQSKDAIQNFNKMYMTTIIWDLEEIKEHDSLFYTLHKLQIDSEINALKRILQYERRQPSTS